MEHDIIAYLYPHNDHDSSVTEAIEGSPRYRPPRLAQPSRTRPGRHGRRNRGERESTEPPENPGASALDYLPCLVVRLGDVPRTNKGLVFGSNPNCDVVLRGKGVSNVHFSLTFDESNRPIIKDLNSFMGTQVTYDGGGQGVRRDFRWIVGGHDTPREKKCIVITVPDTVSIQVVVQPFDIKSPAYVGGVGWFKQGTATTEALLESFGLSNPLTRPRTGAHTPGTGEIYLRKKLGEGSFGVVTHLWNVSTGDEHVVKTPNPKMRVDRSAWEREVDIMGLVSHPHIVKVIKSFAYPQPELHLEYMSYGSLDDHKDISYSETFTILHQCSSALAYLHSQEIPIAHRDIKPPNILVESRTQYGISVKLGDFGLSRPGFELSTLCGTYLYLAPEVHSDSWRLARNKDRLGYTVAVDIWSLGVVACELLYGLPPYTTRYNGYGVAWCEKIRKELVRNVQGRPTALGSIVMNCMVVLPPGSRYCASDCFGVLEDLRKTEGSSFHGLSPPSYFREEDQTLRYTLQNGEDDDLSTVIWQPTPEEQFTSPYFVRSQAPPPESLPSSSRMVQQHQESGEPSSSSIRRYGNWKEGHELEHFQEDYSADEFNPLYVGSSLASHLGGNNAAGSNSEAWANQFLQESSQCSQAGTARSQTGRRSGTTKSSIPRSERGEGYLPSGTHTVEGGNAIDADEYKEMAEAALLLQTIGQDPRTS
ncbi:hypothetical protein MY3296_001664 [Beauveria thailandica]